MPEILDSVEPYSLEHASLAEASAQMLSEWNGFVRSAETSDPFRDPEWLAGYFAGQTRNLVFYSVKAGGRVRGVAPFLKRDWPLKWHFGEWSVAKFPLTRFRLLGGTPLLPEDESVHNVLFRELAGDNAGRKCLFFDGVPENSFFWTYLQRSPLIGELYLRYMPDPPSPRPLLRFEGGFEDYMSKFSSKHRKNLNRSLRKVREGELGEMSFVRYERPHEVEEFLRPGVAVSRLTYQWNLHQRGLYDTELVRGRLAFCASRGWMRCYVLFCGGRPCAYAVGLQYRDRFLLEDIGFDPSLAKHSVGTVLQMLMVEDLFAYNRPELFDLGEYGGYKEALSTEQYMQGRMFLFPKSAYARIAVTGDRCFRELTKTVSSTLDRFELKSRIKQAIRGWRPRQSQ